MRRIFLSASAAALLTAPAFAAEMSAMEPDYDWSGFYIGLNSGYAWTGIDKEVPLTSFRNSYDADGWFIGGHAGFNGQSGWFVGGVELDAAWADIDGDDGGAGGTVDRTGIDLMGAANLRAGAAIDRVLVFATLGVAAAEFEQSNDTPGTSAESSILPGWTVGGGADFAVTDHFILGVAYRYVDYGDKGFNLGGPLAPNNIDPEQHQVRFTGSYKF